MRYTASFFESGDQPIDSRVVIILRTVVAQREPFALAIRPHPHVKVDDESLPLSIRRSCGRRRWPGRLGSGDRVPLEPPVRRPHFLAGVVGKAAFPRRVRGGHLNGLAVVAELNYGKRELTRRVALAGGLGK